MLTTLVTKGQGLRERARRLGLADAIVAERLGLIGLAAVDGCAKRRPIAPELVGDVWERMAG